MALITNYKRKQTHPCPLDRTLLFQSHTFVGMGDACVSLNEPQTLQILCVSRRLIVQNYGLHLWFETTNSIVFSQPNVSELSRASITAYFDYARLFGRVINTFATNQTLQQLNYQHTTCRQIKAVSDLL